MHVERLPRKLLYRWADGDVETEYATDIPTPPPEIKCEEVQVSVPPPIPNTFVLWGLQSGSYRIVSSATSWAQPTINVFPWAPPRYEIGLRVMNQFGVWGNGPGSMITTNWYLTPGNSIATRRDLLIGGDRIQNPTVNAPCGKTRFTGGQCPPNSIDCGSCCLDCAAVVAGIEGLTATVKGITGR